MADLDVFAGLVLNMGLLSLCALLVTIAAAFNQTYFSEFVDQTQIKWRPLFCVYTGLVFGLTAALLIFASLRIEIGAVVDARSAPLVISGIVGGPIAAFLAACLGGLARYAVGGAFVWGGVLSMFIYAFVGLALGRVLRIDLRKPGFKTALLLFACAVVVTICILPVFFVDQNLEKSAAAVRAVFPMVLMQNPIGVVLLGAGLMLTFRIINDREEMARISHALKNSNAQLSEENRRLFDFSAIVAHDLKAPVVRIGTLTQFLEEDIKEAQIELPEQIREEIRYISESVDAMKRLIDDLANYSISQNNTVEASDVDPVQNIRRLVADMKLPRNFEVVIADEMPMVRLPAAGFDIVMRNLISNAVKHHDRDMGHIEISACREGNMAVILVKDDGPGVDRNHLERMFRPLERLAPEGSDGSGLGLSFVSGLTNAWGGKAEALLTGERGLTMKITAPLSAVQPRESRAAA